MKVDSPHKGPGMWKMFPCHDVITHMAHMDVYGHVKVRCQYHNFVWSHGSPWHKVRCSPNICSLRQTCQRALKCELQIWQLWKLSINDLCTRTIGIWRVQIWGTGYRFTHFIGQYSVYCLQVGHYIWGFLAWWGALLSSVAWKEDTWLVIWSWPKYGKRVHVRAPSWYKNKAANTQKVTLH